MIDQSTTYDGKLPRVHVGFNKILNFQAKGNISETRKYLLLLANKSNYNYYLVVVASLAYQGTIMGFHDQCNCNILV